jgi:hypothetical protein
MISDEDMRLIAEYLVRWFEQDLAAGKVRKESRRSV